MSTECLHLFTEKALPLNDLGAVGPLRPNRTPSTIRSVRRSSAADAAPSVPRISGDDPAANSALHCALWWAPHERG